MSVVGVRNADKDGNLFLITTMSFPFGVQHNSISYGSHSTNSIQAQITELRVFVLEFS